MQLIVKRIQEGKASSKDLFKAIDDEVKNYFNKKKKIIFFTKKKYILNKFFYNQKREIKVEPSLKANLTL
jgi:hypothetical protein